MITVQIPEAVLIGMLEPSTLPADVQEAIKLVLATKIPPEADPDPYYKQHLERVFTNIFRTDHGIPLLQQLSKTLGQMIAEQWENYADRVLPHLHDALRAWHIPVSMQTTRESVE